jgi:predicted HicB family RNase H-like nuclease
MGRPSKGVRARLTVRTPPTLANKVHAAAKRRGMTLNDYLMWVLTRATADEDTR